MSNNAEAVRIQIRSKIAELREMGKAWAREADAYCRELAAYREVCAWVADKLIRLRDQYDKRTGEQIHDEYTRATLRELAEALTSNPRLKGPHNGN